MYAELISQAFAIIIDKEGYNPRRKKPSANDPNI